MQKLSVAVLLSGREQFSVYYGGALARWTHDVYSRLQDRIDVTVFGFPTDPNSAYPLAHKTSGWWRACDLLSRTPILRRYEDHLWLRTLMPRLSSFALVHIHNRPQWAPLLRSFGYRGLIVLHLQNDHLGHWDPGPLDNLAAHLDGMVVCSQYLAGQSSAKSQTLRRKTRVVFNGVNTSLFFPKPELRQPKTIFFVGSFVPTKGPIQLMRAYASVLDKHPDARLVVGGSTSFGVHEETAYVGEVHRLAYSLRKQCNAVIEFPGYIHHDRDLPAFFQRATIFTSPSIFQEPFGLVNAEAMACGTPVVGSNRGGIPEVLGNAGRLIDPDNIAEYAAALSTLLSDPMEQTRLANAALERVRRMFDWDVIAETWLEYLQNLSHAKLGALECA
jgi:glycosyltransferase involved in cell wall biosynthesis